MVIDPSSNDTHEYRWWIPVTYTTQENPNFSDTFPSDSIPDNGLSYSINGVITEANWILFNIQQTGYYRINYDISNWQLIIDQLMYAHTIIYLMSRSQLIDDALNLARATVL